MKPPKNKFDAAGLALCYLPGCKERGLYYLYFPRRVGDKTRLMKSDSPHLTATKRRMFCYEHGTNIKNNANRLRLSSAQVSPRRLPQLAQKKATSGMGPINETSKQEEIAFTKPIPVSTSKKRNGKAVIIVTDIANIPEFLKTL